jgi:hypothetical protein
MIAIVVDIYKRGPHQTEFEVRNYNASKTDCRHLCSWAYHPKTQIPSVHTQWALATGVPMKNALSPNSMIPTKRAIHMTNPKPK